MSPSSPANRSRHGVRLALAALLLAAGCSDDDRKACCGPPPQPALAFDVSGRTSLRYQVQGAPRVQAANTLDFAPWVTARHDSLGGIVISAFRPTDDVHADVFVLQLTTTHLGSYEGCGDVSSGPPPCHGRIVWRVNTSNWSDYDVFDEVTSGSVNVTQLTATHLVATFTLTLHDEMGAGPNQIVLANGVIDTDFADAPTASAVDCTVTRAINHSTAC